ncbi:MAG: sugar phosphate nucleotidyltransferase [Treponema sp.]|nr:sugar phosphate nucleotidyltransferase [Treponema sp.]
MFNDCIIMAGGSGTRLWPASTSARPKQFLDVPQGAKTPENEKGQSFFLAAIERALAVIGNSDDSHVVIVAGRGHTELIAEECSRLSADERKRLALIPEPFARNTAPAIACALQYIDWVTAGRERNILVLTSDHIITPLEVFKADASAAAAMAQADKLAVFGIPPQRPETGYGYIEAAESLTLTPAEDIERPGRYEPEVFNVASFREKPDIETAEAFVAAKSFYWNSGMFGFSSRFMLAEFRRSAPEVILPFSKLWAPNENSCTDRKGLKTLEHWAGLETAYNNTKAISFDYAIAEKCASTVMVKAGFSWTDVGSWDEYSRLAEHTDAEVYGGSAGCFVNSDIPVALCGVEDLIVVVRSGRDGSPPAVLISKKGETQRVKEIVEEIKTAGRLELL